MHTSGAKDMHDINFNEIRDDATIHMVVDEEIELEISMRSQLLEVLESRIAWAEEMLATLNSSTKDASITQHQFEHAAIDALAAAELPCQDIYPKSRLCSPVVMSETSQDPSHSRNARTRPHGRLRGHASATKLLYIKFTDPRSPHTTVVSKLCCTDCRRSDFPTLQGLMNHCRMAHNQSYNTHEDCVAACAILVEDEDEREWILVNGTEVAAGPEVSRPSLQRLFARAVGGDTSTSLALPTVLATSTSTDSSIVKTEPQDEPSPSHEDVSCAGSTTERSMVLKISQNLPAIDTFLRRETAHRGIRTVNEAENVDIGAVNDHTSYVPHKWRMRYSDRSGIVVTAPEDPGPALEDSVIIVSQPVDTRSSGSLSPKPESMGSRFHITSRIVITDKSRWIPPASRSGANTHEWMITVTSPSYARAISTIVSSITVKCISEDVSPSFAEDTTDIANEPPFYVRGTTIKPFLAEVQIRWASSTSDTQQFQGNPPIIVEQWVDIGPEKYSSPVIGEDQTLDVELDRNTAFINDRSENNDFAWEDVKKGITVPAAEKDAEDISHVQRLKALLLRFPMVLKDVKTRVAPKVTYTLVPTTSHLRALTYGRRKAIELGRSRALSEAYNDDPENDGDGNCHKMSPGDVFRWLEKHGHFHRPPPAHSTPQLQDSTVPSLHCPRCGCVKQHHSSAHSCEQCSSPASCPPVSNCLDIAKLLVTSGRSLQTPYNLHPSFFGSAWPSLVSDGLLTNTQLMLSAVDPQLLRCTFPKDDSECSVDLLILPQDDRFQSAAHALTIIAMKIFLRRLVNGAVRCVRQEQVASAIQQHWSRGKIESRLMTPYHVWQGLAQSSVKESDGAAALVAMSVLGSPSTLYE